MGPGHGGPGPNACAWLEGSYTERYPTITRDRDGHAPAVPAVLLPGRRPEPCRPQHAGIVPRGWRARLRAAARHGRGRSTGRASRCSASIGDGEAETGPLAASWHANKFINPAVDGAVLPILHLNGYKIANPTILARIAETDLVDLLRGYGYAPRIVDIPLGSNPAVAHQAMAAALDASLDDIAAIQARARRDASTEMPALADARVALAERLDRPADGRRQDGRRVLSSAPGTDPRCSHGPCAPGRSRGVDALLPTRGAVRRHRRPNR